MRFTDCIDITGESCKTFDGNKKYISTGAVDVDHIVQSQIELVSYDSKPSRANLMTDDKSILFAKMQGTKKILLINEDLKENVYSTGFFSVAPKNNILNKECLYHLLGSKAFLNQKDKYCSGATQKAITLDGLNKIEINIPKLEEQNQIAKRLDVIKRILDSNDLALKKYDDLIKARFVELFGDSEFNTMQWPTKKLSELCAVSSSKRIYQNEQSTEGVPFLRISDLNERIDNVKNAPELFIPINKYNKLKENGLIPTEGDILVTSRGTLGRCYIVRPEDEFYFQDGMISWLSDLNSQITSVYLSQLFAMSGIQKQIASLQAGSTVAYLSITMLKKLNIMLPPLDRQEQFAAFVEQTDKSKLAVQQSLEKTQLLFDSLMQEYFGEN